MNLEEYKEICRFDSPREKYLSCRQNMKKGYFVNAVVGNYRRLRKYYKNEKLLLEE